MHLTAPIGQRKVLKCIGSPFYGDSLLGAIVDFNNRNAATRQLARGKSYGQWADISVQELKAYYCEYAVHLLIETNFTKTESTLNGKTTTIRRGCSQCQEFCAYSLAAVTTR